MVVVCFSHLAHTHTHLLLYKEASEINGSKI